MKKIVVLFTVLVSLTLTSCHNIMWGGDGVLLVEKVSLETKPSHSTLGKYKVECIVLNGYRETLGGRWTDYIWFNSDSLYNVGDTIYIGR